MCLQMKWSNSSIIKPINININRFYKVVIKQCQAKFLKLDFIIEEKEKDKS